jgi:hypothetical protein
MDAKKFSDALLEAGRRLGTASAEFQCLPRSDRSRIAHTDPLLDLVANYDTSTFASGGIDFHVSPRDLGDRIDLGRYHGDLVVLLKASGSIVLEEFGTAHHLLCPVAQSGEALLDALLISSIYLGRATLDEGLYNDHRAKRQAADESAAAAGGDEYQPFFQMLLGCD